MYFWKIDDETIRCLINKQEIDKMGYDMEVLDKNDDAMIDFLNDIIEESLQHIDWNPEHGLQNYAARIMPANQLLLIISCTYPDDLIDRDLMQIEKMTQALQRKVTPERLDAIRNMNGEAKKLAFNSLVNDLQAIYNGQFEYEPTDRSESNEVNKTELPDQIIRFEKLADCIQFCHLAPRECKMPSDLYKTKEGYELFIHTAACKAKQVGVLTTLAQECGAKVMQAGLRKAYLKEHGKAMIMENAMEKL